MIGVKVKGGTNAGRKKSYRGRPADWLCACLVRCLFKTQRGFLKRCPDCGTERPS